MIRGFQPPPLLEPQGGNRLQWAPALGAGVIAGAILLLVPRGNPWSPLTFFSPIIVGRAVPLSTDYPLLFVWAIHLVVSVIYGLVISWAVASLVQPQAMLVGVLAGTGLYLLNLAVVSICWPELRGNEGGVFFTHLVFGLVASGAYRGLLRRKTFAEPSNR
jgi:hypothetical protein